LIAYILIIISAKIITLFMYTNLYQDKSSDIFGAVNFFCIHFLEVRPLATGLLDGYVQRIMKGILGHIPMDTCNF